VPWQFYPCWYCRPFSGLAPQSKWYCRQLDADDLLQAEDIEKIGAGHIDTSVKGITGYLGYFPVELFVDI